MPKNTDSAIYDRNFLLKTSKKSEILQRLGELHTGLSSLSQEVADRPKHLNVVAAELISSKFLGSSDKELRLLSCACVVDILRVYAPDAPYSEQELCSIFRAITRELKGLGTCSMDSSQGRRIFYILQSLSIVKSCVVLVYMALQQVDGATEALVDFFDVLVSNIRQDHAEEVGGHIGAILQECIEESDENLNPDVLCILLSGLLPPTRNENPASYRLCQSVLRRVDVCIQTPVSTIVNKILVGALSDIDETEGYDLDEHVYTLIYELHKISPGLLLRILPNICTQLQAEEIDIRLKAVKLLGSLFSSPHADYGLEYSRNFRDFLGRFVDVASVIREEMIDAGALILKRKPALRSLTEDFMKKRLRDSEWEIRQSALLCLTEVATEDPSALSEDTYAEMAERMKDRRPSIRRSAMLCLARLYARHISGRFADVTEAAHGGKPMAIDQFFGSSPEVWSLFKRVPGYIISCWGYPEFVDKQLVMQLLQEYIVPRYEYRNSPEPSSVRGLDSSPGIADGRSDVADSEQPGSRHEAREGVRAMALLAMWSTLDGSGRSGLATILGFKSKVRKCLGDFLGARTGSSSSMALRKSMLHLLSIWVPQEKKHFTSDTLNSLKDNNVYRLLSRALESPSSEAASPATALSGRTGFHSNCVYRDDLRARAGSKSALGEYMSGLYETAAFMVATRDTVQNLVCAGKSIAEAETGMLGGLFLSLISMLSKYCPQSFEGSNQDLSGWLKFTIEGHKRSRGGASRPDAPADKNATLSLLSTVKLSASFLWPVCQVEISSSSGRKSISKPLSKKSSVSDKNDLCDALFGWCTSCTEPTLCYALAEAACALIDVKTPGEKLSSTNASTRWSAYVPGTIKQLTSPSSLSLNEDAVALTRLACNLNTLAPLCVIGAMEAVDVEAKISTFISEIFLSGPSSGRPLLNKLGVGEVEVLVGAIRVWAACAVVTESIAPQVRRGDASSSQNSIQESTITVLSALFSALQRHGSQFGRTEIKLPGLKERLREACGCALMDVVKVKAIGRSLTVAQWHTLAWTLIDSSKECRRKTLTALCLVIQTSNVHPRFLALPCLVANDDDNRQLAQQAFEFSIKRLRLSHDVICSKVMVLEDQDNEEEAERMRRVAEGNMPECVLPFVIHLLSYHPDFPVSLSLNEDGDNKRVNSLNNSLKMVINALLGSGGSEVGINLSYMLKQVEILGTYYCDKLNPENEGLILVANLAREILNEKCRVAENLQPYPGEITLPMDLFRRRPRGTSPAGLSPEASTPTATLKKMKTSGSARKPSRRSGDSTFDKPSSESAKKRALDLDKENELVELPSKKLQKRSSSRIREKPPLVVYEDIDRSDDEVEDWEQAAADEAASSQVKKKSQVLQPTKENVKPSAKRASKSSSKLRSRGKLSDSSGEVVLESSDRNRRSSRGKVSDGQRIENYFSAESVVS